MTHASQGKSSRSVRFTRSHAVLRLRRRLERDAYPRLQMSLIVVLTAAVGFLFSYLLLRFGLESMMLRYPLALLGAYGFFMFTLWLWLRTTADQHQDWLDAASELEPHFSGSYEYTPRSADNGDGMDVSALADTDELAIPLLAVVFVIGTIVASFYVVYLAPVLFAELLFDGVLAFTLYRHLRSAERSHWLQTALRRTAVPFVLTAVFLAVVGAAMAN
jgi:Zn-dependent protease